MLIVWRLTHFTTLLTYETIIPEPAHLKFGFLYLLSKLALVLIKTTFFDLNSTRQNLGELFHCAIRLKERGLKIWSNILAKANVYSRLCSACAGPKRILQCTNSWMKTKYKRVKLKNSHKIQISYESFTLHSRERNTLFISPT